MKSILADLEYPDIQEEIYSLWMEYEEGTSPEAELARQLDKLEMIIQANEYEEQQPGTRLERFFTSTEHSFSHPQVLAWAEVARSQHAARFSAEGTTDAAKDL